VKRFYTAVTPQQTPDGWEIHLDGKPIRTPSRRRLLAPNDALAQELAREWAAQEDEILPATMPLTQILTTAVDRVAQERSAMQAGVLNFLDTDLLCYRAGHPAALVARQAALWDPWLEWFEQEYGAHLRTSDHLKALTQPEAAHSAAESAVAALDDMRFTLLQLIVAASGSLILGLAFMKGRADADRIFAAMHAEENFKEKIYRADIYGLAPHEEKQRESILKDLKAAQVFLAALG
jgi:chaperone required for assembly of F1-ATPase